MCTISDKSDKFLLNYITLGVHFFADTVYICHTHSSATLRATIGLLPPRLDRRSRRVGPRQSVSQLS